jgi:hypothetical protein
LERLFVKIPLSLLADEANVSQEGKLNVLGIFDRIAAAAFPVVHPKMIFAFRVQADAADGGRTFPVEIALEGPDGGVLFEANGEIGAPPVPPGEFTTFNQLFNLVGMQFPEPGLYRFIVRIEGEVRETPLILEAAPSPDHTLN